MKKYKLYLFDFDGTLFNTYPALCMVYKMAFKAFGVEVSDEEVRTFSREPIPDSYQRKGLDMKYFWDFVKVINYYLNGEESVNLTEVFEDTVKFHDYVKKNNIQIGIVTSNNIPHVKDIYKAKGIDCSHFAVFVGNQEAQTPKPDPLPILTALKMVNYDGDLMDVVYIGDSPNDALAAKNAKIDAYLLDRHNEYADQPYKIIHSLLDLFDY
ncbi:MAG: HAD family hydrolase [Bacilli bacterium]|nr:HAD family hydrolase [Bacilli bacterium]